MRRCQATAGYCHPTGDWFPGWGDSGQLRRLGRWPQLWQSFRSSNCHFWRGNCAVFQQYLFRFCQNGFLQPAEKFNNGRAVADVSLADAFQPDWVFNGFKRLADIGGRDNVNVGGIHHVGYGLRCGLAICQQPLLFVTA